MPIRYNDKHYDFDGDVYTGDKLVFQRQRRGIPITYWRHWYRSAIENVDALDVSVAVRHNLVDPDKVYVAYVSTDNVLTVKSALITARAEGMTWATVTTIAGCAACALEFEGHFRHVGSKVEFRTDEIPYLCYVTTAGALYVGLLGGQYEQLAAADVTAVDAINGVSNTYDAQDQGFFVFYIVSGTVYYNTFADGAWEGQREVSIAPANAVAIKAERTFDYRIVLQVQDNSGALYEVFTKMEATGWNGTEIIDMAVTINPVLYDVIYKYGYGAEYIDMAVTIQTANLYGLPPVMVEAENRGVVYEGETDYGYDIYVRFNENVFSVTGNELAFTVTDEASQGYGVLLVEYADGWVHLNCQNFNNADGDLTVDYTPGTIIGDVELVESGTITFTPIGLVPYATTPPVPVSVINIMDWSGAL